MSVRELWLRLTAWTRRGALERELAREMEEHAELLARDLVHERGMDPVAARAAARRQLGNVTRQREASRDYWGFPSLEAFASDLRHAVRGLVRAPAFTATVVITLGLGLGANAAMFAVIDRLMFRPFPYMRDPGSVNRVYIQSSYRGNTLTHADMPYTRYLDLRRDTHSFSQYAPVSEWRLAAGTGQDARIRRVAGVGAEFWGLFDARPALGRWFTPAEDSVPDGTRVAVLGYGFWKTAFGGRDVLNERIQVGPAMFTVVGVAPAAFVGVSNGRTPEIFVPITTIPAIVNNSSSDYPTSYRWDWIQVIVRRTPGVSLAAASADLTTAYSLSRAAQRVTMPTVLPDSIAHPRGIAGALRLATGPDAGLESRVLLWAMGVALFVLLIACANIANLMLARVLSRRREVAVRLALGVSRRRLVAQFVTEGLLLAALGCAAGLLAAQWGGVAIRNLLLPDASSFTLLTDWRTLGVAAACAVAAALLTAAGPTWLATRSNLSSALKAGSRAGHLQRGRLRGTLLVLQGGLSVALLVGAGLFVRSLRNVLAIPLGYDASAVLEIRPDFRDFKMDSLAEVAMRDRLLAAVQAIPGVESAARVNSPLYSTSTAFLVVPGIDSVARLGRFNFQVVTPEFFHLMRTRILRGRGFTGADRFGSPFVAIVSASMAQTLWPGKDALGQCIHVGWHYPGTDAAATPCTTVVGVAENTADQGITDDRRLRYYLSADQLEWLGASTIYARVTGADVEALGERVRRAMQAAMPGDGFVVVSPVQEAVDDQQRSWRLGATLFLAFGGLALLVAAVGLYGAIGYNVAQRMHELGVRIALGARSGNILRLIVGQGLAFAAAGAAIGLFIALVAARWMQPLLYKESARDPLVYGVVTVMMGVVAIVASAVPAMRAARADPNRALRAE